jgi:hypothetical protein
MKHRFRFGAASLVLFGLGVLSCSTRSPVSQAKDGTRSAAAGDGSAAAVRMNAAAETGARGAPRPKAGTPAAAPPGGLRPLGPLARSMLAPTACLRVFLFHFFVFLRRFV